tara:strand:- start:172 stop:552 length:381 start_codon:yes stop_codon:yes gene_type:complete
MNNSMPLTPRMLTGRLLQHEIAAKKKTTQQPEALRLTQVAPYLENGERGQWIMSATDELRRLYDEVQQLKSDLSEEVLISNAMLEVKDELLEALEKLARLGNGEHYGNSEGNTIARAAIAKAERTT